MRICIFATSFLPRIGGAELVIHQLATHLTRLGHEPIVLAPFRRESQRYQFDYPIHHILPGVLGSYAVSPMLHDCALLVNLLAEKLRARFDLIHAHAAYPAGYAGTLLSRLTDTPTVITCHGADVQKVPEFGYGMRLNSVMEPRIERAIQCADAVIAISDAIKREILALGADPAKVYTIPNGVDNCRFVAPQGDVRGMFSLPSDSKVILAVGRNHPVKGYGYLIQAMPHVLRQRADVWCLIVGRGTENLAPLIDELGLRGKVILAGQIPKEDGGKPRECDVTQIPNDDLVSIYMTSDVFVSSSLIEGFPLVVPEAMAAGLPVIATDVPGNRDAVADGHDGVLVPPRAIEELARKIVLVLEHDGLRRQLSANARETALKHDWKNITDQYSTVYQAVLSQPRF